jgi:type I restriction enzyme, S subunit
MIKDESYKQSGSIEGLTLIPRNWSVRKLKSIAYMKGRIGWQNLRASEFKTKGPYLITGMNFKDGKINWDEVYHITEERFNEAPEIQLQEGDVLMTKDGTIGKLLFIDSLPDKASLNSHLLLFRPLENHFMPKFLYYQLSSQYFQHHVELTKTGTTFYGITQEAVGEYKMLLPPLPIQAAVIRYLDTKLEKIENFISKKRRLIELLHEEKSAIINHGVTKGMHETAPMRPSGIDWLGEIPAHWEVKRLKRLTTTITNGYVGPTRDILIEDGVRYIQSLHIKHNTIKFHTPYFVSEEWSNAHSRSILKENDILVVQTGAGTGNIGIVPKEFEGCNCHALIILRIDKKLSLPPFILNVFLSNYGYNTLKSIETGALHPHLNSTVICDVELPIPPIHEQYQILNFIHNEVGKIKNTISKIEREIELLAEYKTSLIYEVVTGKVKVDTLVEQPLEAM